MSAKTCAACGDKITLLGTRYPLKSKDVICKKCFKKYDLKLSDTMNLTLEQITTGNHNFTTTLESKQTNEHVKSVKLAAKEQFKQKTKGKPFFSMLIRQDSSSTFKSGTLSIQYDYIYQHTAGKVVINNVKEYELKSYSWTPNIVGTKSFSAGKALVGAAIIGEIGLLAGGSGKKGEDKSTGTLLLKEVESGDVVKITGDISVNEAEKLANFISKQDMQ
ncbi:hypothetical protein [Vagococcus salmoninarum]|uniref:hypothetical protein n=1 Tax=Vagococcus salmoninarum TaxID=2739 RepID=UPI003F9D5CA3